MTRLCLGAFFTVAIVLRFVLDLTGAIRPGWRLETAYCILFGAAAAMALIDDPANIFGYASLVLSIGWGVRSLMMFEPNSESATG